MIFLKNQPHYRPQNDRGIQTVSSAFRDYLCKYNQDCPRYFISPDYPLEWKCLVLKKKMNILGMCRLYYRLSDGQSHLQYRYRVPMEASILLPAHKAQVELKISSGPITFWPTANVPIFCWGQELAEGGFKFELFRV